MAAKAVVPAQKNTKDQAGAGAPSPTLYVKNLAEKVNKNDLKRALYMLFSMYGPVLDVVTARVGSKKQTMRGQAHVVFRDVQTGTQAMRGLQGFDLFGKELVIVYARGQSQIFPKLRGTFEPPSSTASAPDTTALQKSIFNAPPPNVPSNPAPSAGQPSNGSTNNLPHGMKRPRDDAEDEEQDEEEVSMDEDDDDAPMDEDDDDDD